MRVRVAEDCSLLKNYDLPFLDLESRLFRSNKLWPQITSFLNYESVIKYANYGGCCMSQRNTAYLLSAQKQITLHKQTHPRGTRKCKYNAALNIHRLFHFLCYSTILSFLLLRSTSEYKILTHCGRVTQICVFNTVKLGTSASSP